jgi:hypothetical protein
MGKGTHAEVHDHVPERVPLLGTRLQVRKRDFLLLGIAEQRGASGPAVRVHTIQAPAR